MDAGTSDELTRPRSSGCSNSAIRLGQANCALKTLTVKSIKEFAADTWRNKAPVSHGKPPGCNLLLNGLGPAEFALLALESVLHGGEAATTSYSPLWTAAMIFRCRDFLSMSCLLPPLDVSISVMSTLMPVPEQAFFKLLAKSIFRFSHAKRYRTRLCLRPPLPTGAMTRSFEALLSLWGLSVLRSSAAGADEVPAADPGLQWPKAA